MAEKWARLNDPKLTKFCLRPVCDRYLNHVYYTLYSPSFFSLAESLQLILGNSASYRLFTNLLHNFQEQCQVQRQRSKNVACRKYCVRCDNALVVICFKTMYNYKTIVRFGFCDIRNNQGYQPQPLASADKTYLGLDYSGYR